MDKNKRNEIYQKGLQECKNHFSMFPKHNEGVAYAAGFVRAAEIEEKRDAIRKKIHKKYEKIICGLVKKNPAIAGQVADELEEILELNKELTWL